MKKEHAKNNTDHMSAQVNTSTDEQKQENLKAKVPTKKKLTAEQMEELADNRATELVLQPEQMKKPKIPDYVVLSEIENRSIIFRDQNNDAFIAPNGDGTKIYRIGAKNREFRSWLANFLRREFHMTAPKANKLDAFSQALESIALDTELSAQYPLEVRTVYREANEKKHIKQDELWYDLGESAIRITSKDWYYVKYPPILFRRFSQQLPQAAPEKGGNLLELAKFINLTDKNDILLFLVFAVSAFIPGYPRPLCLLYGTQGAGKSTPGRLLKRLIDPTAVEGTVLPKRHEEFVQTANHHALLVFDNISSIKPEISDALARVSTGDTFSKRALFTDDDDIVYRLQRPVMLNGINQVISQSDLLDRSILLEMQRISSDKVRPEKDFWREFEEQKSMILGSIFGVISKAMATFPTVQLQKMPRMADFAKWGYAIAENIDGYTGMDFIRAYSQNVGKQHDEAIESSAVGLAVYLFIKERIKGDWCGTATELMRQIEDVGMVADSMANATSIEKEVNTIVNGSLWPKDPEWFMRRLNYVLPDLESRGIHFTTYRDNKKHRRMINIALKQRGTK